ncbi:sodium ion-translocating decarboxylase subunit beta [Magnetospirillum gryphiswaldense]|uniref:oxaloacetate decarboxylase (Na(+) extruding) n=1 Tax=Magnetospirillum gryphiswaldense TaxID=55518 RepID=A4U4M3_9PROT|nr:sodium ion-translocating decarboxylase subunit beta [Magnetospirillum gryphiswaldense]AVM72657.1 Carboxybiotin decarboxylase [Magnetospirillum gryphiswaldense MSR-1]AVM76560.1 Carboxybiotin decarboxylase [Magnetospirillum gryphiswaldense]CAM77830.1 decarboxylase beta subunit [Magnetospirillum gryphiswaldense MSR-1]
MDRLNVLDLFQGLATLAAAEPSILVMRLVLIALGVLLIYLGKKGVLEALLMIPMGLGMATINAAVLFVPEGGWLRAGPNQIFVDALVAADNAAQTTALMNILQINWLQPIYTFTFSNGLIACVVFLGIGVLLDVGYVMARPFQSMILALFGELGTIAVYPIAIALGLTPGQAASVAIIGGADGPMVLFTSLSLARELFVPITVVAYLYLGLTYGGYPYLIRLLIPARLRALPMPMEKPRKPITSGQKIAFSVTLCILLSLLFPVASPLILCLFLGVIIRESNLVPYMDLLGGVFLYGGTFFLGLLLGVLCEARLILDPQVLVLLLLGMLALLISGIGGIIGGYVLYFASGRKFNPVIGIAAVSCVPTTAKVAQKEVTAANPGVVVMPHALGANISGVITTAILAAIYVTVIQAVY